MKKTGPGYAVAVTDPAESWQSGKKDVKYVPLQAMEGDYAIFLKDAAMEIEFEEKKYLVVPHSAFLLWCGPTSLMTGRLHDRSLPARAAEKFLAMSAEDVQNACPRWIRPQDFVQITVGP